MKALVFLLALLLSVAHAETKLSYSGDAYVRGYFKNSTGNNGTQAFNQFFRLNVVAKPDDNLSVKIGAVLASDSWEGDNHKGIYSSTTQNTGTAVGGTNDDGFGNDNVTRLDHAVIEYSKNNWITSVGRHVVTTPGSFVTSDDRRDRIQVIKIRDNYDAVAFAYDKRAEGALNNAKDDVDMYSLNYYGAFSGMKYALQTGYWTARKYNAATSGFNGVNLDNVKQFSPQLEGSALGIDFNFYYTLLWGGSAYYKDEHHAAALKLAHDFEIFKVEFQSMATLDGGLIAGGFDSLSSVVNNSPDHNQSSIKLRTVGFGLGNKQSDDQLHMLRFSKIFSQELSATVGGGYGVFYNTTSKKDEKNTLVDATARYSFSQYLSLSAAYGRFFGDYEQHAGSLTLKAVL
nr:porin [Bacteriovorax sp. HI3]